MTAVRPAKHVDAMRMVALLVEKQRASMYAGVVDVDEDYARKMLAALIQRHGGTHTGSTCVFVVDGDDGQPCAFVVGILDRIYQVGNRLVAQDAFLVAGDGAPAAAVTRLLDAYLDWASGNPNVFEINLSHTDILPTGPRMGALYERKGFVACGSIYRKMVGGEA